jgi:hypothetical protein
MAGMFNWFLSLSFCRHSLPYFTTDDFSPEASFCGHFKLARPVYHPGEQSLLCLIVTATNPPERLHIQSEEDVGVYYV